MTTPLVEDPRIGRFPFVVEPFSEDCAGRLSWRFLGNHLLRCASLHAGAHGFGFDDMIGKRLVWVLSRLVVEMPNMPTTGQHYDIHTWVARIYRQFTDRYFAITAPDGTPYGHAFSTWALISLDTREPVDLTDGRMAGIGDACADCPLPIAPPGRIRLVQPEAQGETVASYTDLDINGHVNSIRYIELLLDRISKQEHAANPVTRIEMQYAAESGAGDRLQISADSSSEGAHRLYVIKRDDGTLLCRGILHQTM